MPPDKSPPTDFPLIVDAHAHLGSFRNFHVPDNDAAGLVRAMDALGIDVAVVAHHAGISADFRFGNDEVMAAAGSYPGRLLGYCCVNPNYPHEVRRELERCFAQPAIRGIKLHPELHGNYPLDGPGYEPVWEFAADHTVPVLAHTYFGGDPLDVFAEIADRHPSLPLIVGHSGVDFGPERVAALAADHANLWLDLCGPLSFDGLAEYLVGAVGAGRLLFGSDQPFIGGASQLGTLVHARLCSEDLAQILGDNARALFRISPVPKVAA